MTLDEISAIAQEEMVRAEDEAWATVRRNAEELGLLDRLQPVYEAAFRAGFQAGLARYPVMHARFAQRTSVA